MGLDHPGGDPIARRRAAHEHDLAAVARDRVAAGRQRLDLELDDRPRRPPPAAHPPAHAASTGAPRAAPSASAALPSRTAISSVPAEPT